MDPCGQRRLLVAGHAEVQVWALKPCGKVADRLPLNAPWQAEGGVLTAGWLPASDTSVWVLTGNALRCYALHVEAASPAWVLSAPDTLLVAAIVVPGWVVALDHAGQLWRGALRQCGSQGQWEALDSVAALCSNGGADGGGCC